MDRSDLLDRLIALLRDGGIRFCVIGGQAVNAYVEPVVSLDFDIVVAVEDLSGLTDVLASQFRVERFEHSVNVSAEGSDLRVQKDRRLALQVDVTATPRHDNGAIFVQTVSDYPLVEAIHQNVVKHPVLPDAASRAKLREATSAIFTEKYDDYAPTCASEYFSWAG